MAFCVRDSFVGCCFFVVVVFTACQVCFYVDATVQRENQYDFYLPHSGLVPYYCSVTLSGYAVLLG